MWKILMKDVDLEGPKSFLDHVYLGCTQREMRNEQRYCRKLQNYVWIRSHGITRKKWQGNLLHPEIQRIHWSRKWTHNFRMSPAAVPRKEKVYSIVRQIYDRCSTGNLDDLDVNTAIWSIFLNTTLQAAIHLGRDCAENLRFIENHLWKSVKHLFEETEKLIKNQTEISGLTTIDCKEHTWKNDFWSISGNFFYRHHV